MTDRYQATLPYLVSSSWRIAIAMGLRARELDDSDERILEWMTRSDCSTKDVSTNERDPHEGAVFNPSLNQKHQQMFSGYVETTLSDGREQVSRLASVEVRQRTSQRDSVEVPVS